MLPMCHSVICVATVAEQIDLPFSPWGATALQFFGLLDSTRQVMNHEEVHDLRTRKLNRFARQLVVFWTVMYSYPPGRQSLLSNAFKNLKLEVECLVGVSDEVKKGVRTIATLCEDVQKIGHE
jgi:hypothetical protein